MNITWLVDSVAYMGQRPVSGSLIFYEYPFLIVSKYHSSDY